MTERYATAVLLCALLCASLSSCKRSANTGEEQVSSPAEAPVETPKLQYPSVVSTKLLPLTDGVDVYITRAAISVGDKTAVALEGGEIPDEERFRGASGVAVPALGELLKEAGVGRSGPVNFHVDKTVPFSVLYRSVFTLGTLGPSPNSSGLVVRGNGGLRRLPLEPSPGDLRRLRQIRDGGVPAGEPLWLVVSIDAEQAVVWSISGRAGTVDAPAAKVAPSDTKALASALKELGRKHWEKTNRSGRDTVSVQADDAVQVQTVATVCALLLEHTPYLLLQND